MFKVLKKIPQSLFFFILLLLAQSGAVQAHIYQYTNPYNPEFKNSIRLGNQEYIRIIEHPEMKGYFSYGLCEKIITDYRSAEPNHLHEKCITAPGKFWWLLHNLKEESIPDSPYRPTYLAELLQKDNNWYGGLQLADVVSWIGCMTGAGAVAKFAVKGATHFIASGAIAWATHDAFWKGSAGITQKFSSDTYRATMPYTRYENWSGKEDLILDASATSYISLDQCIEQCLAEPEYKIRNKFFELLDEGIIKTQEPRHKGDAYNVKDFGYDTVCELYCESKGHPEFAVPHIRDLWSLMAATLVSSSNDEFKRVAFDYGIEIFPWSDHEPNIQITYMTPEQIQRYKNAKDTRFKGDCLIGSACDKKYPMRRSNPQSLAYKGYKKTTIEQLQKNYSLSILNQLTQAGSRPTLTNFKD